MVTRLPDVVSIHDIGQDPLKGVLVSYQPANGTRLPLYQCQLHGYYLEDNPRVCAHIKLAMHEKGRGHT